MAMKKAEMDTSSNQDVMLLASLRAQKKLLQDSIKSLEARLAAEGRLAGVPDLSVDLPTTRAEVDIPAKIRMAISRESLEEAKIAKTIGEPLEKVHEAIQTLRSEHKIFNVGLGENPKWTWRIGEDADGPALKATILRLIAEQPMTTRELTDATGVKMSRVGGAMVDIQRSDVRIVNLGVGHAGRWYILSADTPMPPGVRDARLGRKKRKPA